MDFNRRKMEDQRRQAAEKEAAARDRCRRMQWRHVPICKSDAEEIKSGFIDGKTFRCAKHGEFQVSDSVLNVPALMDADTSQWETALKNAAWRADPGLRPRILSYDF
jgi:hypothetical protein